MANIIIGGNFIEVECTGSSNIVFEDSFGSLVLSFGCGACCSQPLTNEDINEIISFLNTHRPID